MQKSALGIMCPLAQWTGCVVCGICVCDSISALGWRNLFVIALICGLFTPHLTDTTIYSIVTGSDTPHCFRDECDETEKRHVPMQHFVAVFLA